jgi:chaperonin GroEL (HSP60 family)
VDGEKGVIVDMNELGVWDPLSVKVQTLKTAVEVSPIMAGCLCVFTMDADVDRHLVVED